jgi:hypothetical protein
MSKIKGLIRDNPQVALSIPTVLCFVQFLTSIWGAITTGTFDHNTINQLLASADGFESVILFGLMVALKEKKQ